MKTREIKAARKRAETDAREITIRRKAAKTLSSKFDIKSIEFDVHSLWSKCPKLENDPLFFDASLNLVMNLGDGGDGDITQRVVTAGKMLRDWFAYVANLDVPSVLAKTVSKATLGFTDVKHLRVAFATKSIYHVRRGAGK